MTALTQAVTMASLGRHLGKRVTVDNTNGVLVGLLDDTAFVQLEPSSEVTQHKPDEVIPLLRPLSELTEVEAKECFRVAFGKAANRNYGLVVDRDNVFSSGQICISAISEGLRLAIAFDCVSAWFLPKGSSTMHAMTFNAVALVRYLDSIAINLETTSISSSGTSQKRTDNHWLVQLSDTTLYRLDDLEKAYALVNEKEKFRTYVQIATLTGEESMYIYINRLINSRM